ncbi:MAG: hypothetical protein AAGA08_13455 [Pseudomonadota bacterium]
MSEDKFQQAPDGEAWPSMEDLKFLDSDGDPGAALGMFRLPHPIHDYDVPPTHEIYGSDLLDRHEWRRSVYVIDFLCESDWKAKLIPLIDAEHAKVDFEEQTKIVADKQMKEEEINERRDEIIGETVDFLGLFENSLHIDSHSHTLSIFLARVMMRIGWEVSIFFKERYGAIRPVARDAINIKPIIRTPAHPSYPSAHSTQAHLAKYALHHVSDGHFPPTSKHAERLEQIATRVAENREYAGVHFEADSAIGRLLATNIWEIAMEQYSISDLAKQASLEWDNPSLSSLTFTKRRDA